MGTLCGHIDNEKSGSQEGKMGENGQRFVGIAKSSRAQTVGAALDDPLPKNSVVCKAESLSTASPVGPFPSVGKGGAVV